jgi:hypothetical protein
MTMMLMRQPEFHGFASVTLYGDVTGANLTDESPIVCAACRK